MPANGHNDHVDRLNRELDEQIARGAKSLDALAIVRRQEHELVVRDPAAWRRVALEGRRFA